VFRAAYIALFLLVSTQVVSPQAAQKAGAGSTAPTKAAAAKSAPTRPALRISLEKKAPDGKIQTVSSDHVFDPGDIVHFQVQSDFDGFLYVMNQGSSGRFATVFPSTDAGSDNRVRQGQTFYIPAIDDSWFQISGPAGFEVLYFLLSPEAIATPAPSSFVAPGPISSLRPRCNDSIFCARGECTDVTAGPAALPQGAPLPAPLAPIAGMASRDITVVKKQGGVTVGTSGNKTVPVIYTFRMAHN
jgi:hypothetical protein